MAGLDDFGRKYFGGEGQQNTSSALDSFANKYLQPQQAGEQSPASALPPGADPFYAHDQAGAQYRNDEAIAEQPRNFLTNLGRDIVNIGNNWLHGIGAAADEAGRAQRDMIEAEKAYAAGGSAEDHAAAYDRLQRANRQVVRDAIGTPAMVGALAGVPGAGVVAMPIVARDMYDAAKQRYQSTNERNAWKALKGDEQQSPGWETAKQVAGDVTGIAPLVEEAPKVLTADYWQQAYEAPISTVGGTAMTVVPSALMLKGGYRAAKKGVEQRTVKALDEFIQPDNKIVPDGLSKADYALTEVPEYNGLMTALQNLGEKKWDAAELGTDSRSRFDPTNVKSPEKTRLAGEGVILGEQTAEPGRVILPNETEPNQTGLGAIADLRKQVESDSAYGQSHMDPNYMMEQAARAGNYRRAASWAEAAGQPDQAARYRNLWWKAQGFTDEIADSGGRTRADLINERRADAKQTIEAVTQQIADERRNVRQGLANVLEFGKRRAWDTAETEAATARMNPEAMVMTEYLNTHNIAPEVLERSLRRRQEKLVSDYMNTLRGQMKQGAAKATMENASGDMFSRNYSMNYEWYRNMLDANGGRFPNKANLEYWLRETAVDHLRNGYKDILYGELPASGEFRNLETALSGLGKYRKQLPVELSRWQKDKIIPEKAIEQGAQVGSMVDSAPPPAGLEYMAASGGRGVPVGGSQTPSGGAQVPGAVTRRQILSRIDDMFTPVRTGRLGVRNVLGWFNPQSEIARSKSFGDFQTAMHEIGHYVDHQIGLRQNPAFDGELVSYVRRNFGNAYDHLPPDRLRAEGIAEFFREYTTDHNQAAQNFPGYYRAFESKMQQVPEIKAKIEDISGLLHTWYNQAPEARVKGSISFGDRRTALEKGWDAVKHPAETAKALVENGRKAFDTAYDQFVDQLAPLDRMMREIEKTTGQKLPLVQDVFKQAWLTRGWVGKAEALIKKGAPGVPALEKIIKTVEHDYEGFSAYVVALREMDAYRLEATAGAKFEHAITQADAARTVEKYQQDPKFVSAQQDLVKFNNHLLDMLVESGLKDHETVEMYRQKWPNYVPFFREFNDSAVEKFLGTKGFGNVSNPIKKFEGSTRDILSPVESIVKNVYQFTNLAERNKVGRLFVDLAQKPGLGKLIEEVSGSASSKDSTFGVWVNGTKKVFQTEPELYRAIMLLDKEPAQGILKVLQIPASLLRAGAVLSPEFIIRNPVRDAFTAFVNSKYGFIPGIDTARGLVHLLKKDNLYWEYQRSGAAHAAMVSMDRDYLAQGVRNIMKKTAVQKATTVINPKTYVDILRTFSEATEVATRLAEYENARRGYTGVMNRLFSNQRRAASMQEAALGSRDVTLDFSRSGIKGKEINRYVAFWNATIQGSDKMIRAFKDVPVQTSAKVFMSITLPSIVLYYMNRDDPRYQELPQWQKDIFWVIPTKDTLIKIPKPFEMGILFGTSVERMLQWMDEKGKGIPQAGKKAFKGFGNTVFDALAPGWIPTAMLPILEWQTNYSFFMNRNIVPPSQSKLPAKFQYGPNTSAIGRAIGERFDTSPSKIDNTIRGYTGGLGGLGLFVGDAVAGEFDKRPAMRGFEYPGIRAFTATPYRSSQSVQEFYDRFGEQEKLYNEYKQTKDLPPGFNPAEYQRLKAVNQIMQQIHKQEKAIMADPRMNSAEKRNRLDQLQIHAVNYARMGLGNKSKVAQ